MKNTTMTYTGADIKVLDFWERGITGKNVKIGIVDHGQAHHPALPVSGGIACLTHDTYYYAEGEHHTHCAGIALGRNLENGKPTGIAPDALNYVVRMYMLTITTRVQSYIQAIDWAIAESIDILSISQHLSENSFLFDKTQRTSSRGCPKHLRIPLRMAFDRAYRAGIIIVVASGNNGADTDFIELLPKMPGVVGVSNMDWEGFIKPTDHTGNWVKVGVGGTNILSTGLNDGYSRLSGTSMSTPAIAGYLALFKELFPVKTPQEIVQVLYDNMTSIKGTPAGFPHPPKELYNLPVITEVNELRRFTNFTWQPVDAFVKQGTTWKEAEAMGYGI